LRDIDVEFRTPSGRLLRLEIEGIQHLDPSNYLSDITRHTPPDRRSGGGLARVFLDAQT